MSDEEEDKLVYVPEFRQGAKKVYRAVTYIRYGIIAFLAVFIALAIFDDGLAELYVEAAFDRTAAGCMPPAGFAISVRNGSWKTAKRIDLSIRAQRSQATASTSPYIWRFSVDRFLESDEHWSGCLSPSLSNKSNRVIFNNPEAFTWEVDSVVAEFAD